MARVFAMNRPHIDGHRVRRQFSRHAGDYDAYAVVQKRVVEGLLERLRQTGSLTGPVLEVGTGTGLLGQKIAEEYGQLPLVLSDIAQGMTRHAARMVPQGMAVDADAQNLPFRAQTFGLLLSSSMYQWVNDLPRAFAESVRVLQPGGRFLFALFGERTLYELRDSHRQAVAEVGCRQPSHAQEFPTRAEVQLALRTAGFAVSHIEMTTEVEYHADVSQLLRGLKKIGAQNATGAAPAGFSSRRVMQRMMELYRQRYGEPGRIPASYEVIYGMAVTPR
ncbi:MAG: methyltransferase domain-containing protein [Desulfuromonadaceae bacterium]